MKGGKKQPYYIYFKKDPKVEIIKEENTSSREDEKFRGKDPSSCKTDVKNTNLKDEFVALGKVKEEDAVHHGDKHLLTMAGLFDCWQAPKVPNFILFRDQLCLLNCTHLPGVT